MQTQSTTLAVGQNLSVGQNVPSGQPAVEPLNIRRVNLRSFLEHQFGKIVSIDFVKKDGSNRTLTGRLGVRKYSNGGENKVVAIDRPYITMFEFNGLGYRTVNLESALAIRANGNSYLVQ